MMAQPVSYKCKIHIENVVKDNDIDGKYHFKGKIISTEKAAHNNSFYDQNLHISGFTFDEAENLKEGTVIKANVSFMGDPIKQNYQLDNIEIV